MTVYRNTAKNWARLGLDRLPEYVEGPADTLYIVHDEWRGRFVLTDLLPG